MDIYKNSDGDFVCKLCNKVYVQMTEALECVETHPKPAVAEEKQLAPQVTIRSDMNDYSNDAKGTGMQTAAERLMLSLIEDYVILRDKDMKEKGNIGPMTFNAGKAAAEAVNNYNKLVYGTKSSSLNVSVDAKKKTDIDALKDMIINGKNDE